MENEKEPIQNEKRAPTLFGKAVAPLHRRTFCPDACQEVAWYEGINWDDHLKVSSHLEELRKKAKESREEATCVHNCHHPSSGLPSR